jgi:hypothetical protein
VINPVRSEREAFRFLVYAMVVIVALIVVALIVQSL